MEIDLTTLGMLEEAQKSKLKVELLLEGGHVIEGTIKAIKRGIVYTDVSSSNAQHRVGRTPINRVVTTINVE